MDQRSSSGHFARIVDAGIDWITCTASDSAQGIPLARQALKIIDAEVLAGNEKRPWASLGYGGVTAGSCQTGERQDGLIVRLGGPLARDNWRALYPYTSNVSRIDCQITVFMGDGLAGLLNQHYRDANRSVKTKPYGPSVSMFHGSDGSATLYVGKRQSEQFGRCYNKGVESGLAHYAGCVRYEVEFKGERAKQVAALAHRANHDAALADGRVREFFQSRRIVPRSPLVGPGQPARSLPPIEGPASTGQLTLTHDDLEIPGLAGKLSSLPGRPADNSRRLDWLRSHVSGVVLGLVADGLCEEVLHSLGVEILNERIVKRGPYF